MQIKPSYLLAGLVVALIISVIFYWSQNQKTTTNKADTLETKISEYNSVINPSNFISGVTNKYFTLKPGIKFIYEQKTEEGIERNEVVVTNQTKKVMAVTTTVVWDRVFLNDQLKEETYDWYAQDKDGNVWYFGEDVNNYENGELKDHQGAWEAGVDEAKAGIIMPKDPTVGHSYRQEYYQGVAEDMGEVIALNKQVMVPYGTFDNCLQTKDWSNVDQGVAYKYYCLDIGFVTIEEPVNEAGKGKAELVSVFAE